ncbi:MAG: HupE/UreJ family protein, partial [Betaproteobacteria bacterium]|nr:HupE/UreJ family protein [Betaproteobacteria bacterium]
VLNLRGRAVVVRERVAIVFGCGLLHGLGFASAMADIGLSGAYRSMSLVGFNVGIEAGQALFLGAVLVIAFLLRRVGAGRLTDPRVPSAVAAVCGSVWLVQRLLGV